MKSYFVSIIFSIVFIGVTLHSFGQNDSTKYIYGERPIFPEFPGGEEQLRKFIKTNLLYPDSAIKNKIEGKVYVQFTIEKDGSISNIKKLGKKTLGYGLEEEALRLIKLMPNWIPGKLDDKPIQLRFNVPIIFKLSDFDTIYEIVDEMPEFLGGDSALKKFLLANLEWPCRDVCSQGKVYVSFIVEKDGTKTDIKIAEKSKKKGFGLEEEALRVVKLMPKWKPGKQNDRVVRVRYTLPITFKIQQ